MHSIGVTLKTPPYGGVFFGNLRDQVTQLVGSGYSLALFRED